MLPCDSHGSSLAKWTAFDILRSLVFSRKLQESKIIGARGTRWGYHINTPCRRAETDAAQAAEGAVKAGVASGGGAALPGMIFNARKWLEYTCADGEKRRVRAGRLECTMQNLVDSLVQRFPEQVTHAAASLDLPPDARLDVTVDKSFAVRFTCCKARAVGSQMAVWG